MERSVEAFQRVVLHPHVLRNVGSLEASTTILGRSAATPMVLAPTGFTRMMRAEGEPAVARPAARARIPYTLSTLGTTWIERLRAEAPDTKLWFQLYLHAITPAARSCWVKRPVGFKKYVQPGRERLSKATG